ncbi:hypothetical protein [Nocardia sp. NPDC051832]|uniref:DUF7373 family lipoprotein n=1 Tax=Nocardia sp. NPDC051832 TaxID=3155673 RepID=UPI0034323A2F
MAGVGCSSATIAGNPQPGMTPVDLTVLKTGAHPREPTEYEPDLGTFADVRDIEAHRTLNYLVVPTDIDNDITEVGKIELFSSPESPFISKVLPDKYRPALVENNLLLGVYVSRTNADLRKRKKLIVSLLRFPTAAISQKAVADLARITDAEGDRHPIAIDGHPTASTSSADDITAISFIARDQFVFLVNAGVPQADQTGLAGVVKKTIDEQFARLTQFKPTAFDDVLDSPVDPDSIMRRALPKATDATDPFFSDEDFGALQPSGALHYERNPLQVRKAFEESGVDLVGRRGAIVYRSRDLAAAFRLQTVLTKAGRNDEELPSPPGLPDTRCIRRDQIDVVRNFDELCAVLHGRFIAIVMTKSKLAGGINPDLYPRAAAQYSVLANSE